MIVESKAIEPKASSATSVYPAVIINITDYSDTFVYLQVYCPATMSGDVIDAKFCLNNWVEAPKYPHTGEDVEAYDYQIGGVVTISYQGGNLDSPLFVRYNVISDSIIDKNAKYITEGVKIAPDQGIFDDITDTTVDSNTVGIQKGVALLPALIACGNTTSFHTYGYKSKKKRYLTIFRCGKYGTELIFKSAGVAVKPGEANFDYITNNSSFSINDICKYLIETEDTNVKNKCLIDVVNQTIKEFETDSRYKKDVYDKTNIADTLFWYSKVAGLVYDSSGTFDTSCRLSPSLKNAIDSQKIKVSLPDPNSNIWKVLYWFSNAGEIALPLYRGTMRVTDGDSSFNRYLLFEFVDKLWKNINANTFFGEYIGTRYAMILVRNLIYIRDAYSAKTLSDKNLIILTVIASAFPTLESTIRNFGLYKEYYDSTSISFMEGLIANIKNGSQVSQSSSQLASNFATMYFQMLEWSPSDSFLFYENPYDKIKTAMESGIDYINKHYDSLKQTLNQNEG